MAFTSRLIREGVALTAPVLLAAIGWEVCAAVLNSRFVPHLTEVAQTIIHSLLSDPIIQAQGGGRDGFLPHIWSTARTYVLCMLIGGGAASVLAIAASPWTFLREAFASLVRPWHVIPPLLAVPLIFAAFGSYGLTNLAAGALYSFIGTASYLLPALNRVPESYIALARLAGARPYWIALRVRSIAALPTLTAPAKIVGAFTLGIVVLIEYLAAPRGIGRVMKFAVSYNDVQLILAGVFWATILGQIYGLLVDMFARSFLHWARPRSSRESKFFTIRHSAHD